jgi:hypothetical protein
MWEFPHGELRNGESTASGAARLLLELTSLQSRLGKVLLKVTHTITRFRIEMTCLEARYRRGEFRSSFYVAGKWIRPLELTRYPVSSPQRKLARRLQDQLTRAG